jgi:hypothetical protein
MEGGNDDLASEQNSPPNFYYVTLGNSSFYDNFFYLETSLDPNLMPLPTNGAIKIGASS